MNVGIAWAVARILRRAGAELHATRAAAIGDARGLAREQERGRYSRILHDRVLQILEGLSRPELMPGPEVRRRVAEEAGWLRVFIVTGQPLRPGHPYSDLHLLAERMAARVCWWS